VRIDHIALWSKDIELLKEFYVKYFNAHANQKYVNVRNDFCSYFLSFEDGARIELMQMPAIPENANDPFLQYTGFIHIAVSVGSEENVCKLTERLKKDGYEILCEPRRTGDGYFESCVFDPEKNRIEITV